MQWSQPDRLLLWLLKISITTLIRTKNDDRALGNRGHSWTVNNEKMTDVNIATNMMIDAYTNAFDIAYVISGDSDLVPPIRAIRAHFAG